MNNWGTKSASLTPDYSSNKITTHQIIMTINRLDFNVIVSTFSSNQLIEQNQPSVATNPQLINGVVAVAVIGALTIFSVKLIESVGNLIEKVKDE